MLTSSITHVLAVTSIRRTRMLPAPGRVIVRKGQRVDSTDVIAQAHLSPEHLLLDVAGGLGVSAGKADLHIQRQVGEDVIEGDVIAGPVGLGRRVFRAPKSGRIVLVGGGQVLLALEGKPFELKAGIPGIVTALIDDYGVEIETPGGLIQGVWGNNRIGVGLLQNLSLSPKDVLTRDRLDVSHRGSVILSGYCKHADVLETAAEIPLRGLIFSSMDSSLVHLAEKMPYPIILTEGFGEIPMNSPAYKLLTTNERREVVLTAEPWDRLAGTRPEIVIPLPASGQLPLPSGTEVFKPGQQVRLLSSSRRGEMGVLTELYPGLTTLPSGVRAPAAEIRLESGKDIIFPLANIEVLK
jgi:hypothetical protein